MSDEGVFTIGGRGFRAVKNTTMEHDIWLGAAVRRSGLRDLEIADDVTSEAFEANAFYSLIDSGEIFNFVGALILPVEVKDDLLWTPALAAETAAFFRTLTDPNDKTDFQRVFLTLVTGFFAPVLASYRSLQIASKEGRAIAAHRSRERSSSSPIMASGTA